MSSIPAAGSISLVGSQADFQTDCEATNSVLRETIGGAAKATVTIAGNAFTPANNEGAHVQVDTSGAAQTLNTITATNCRDGHVKRISINSNSNALTINNGSSAGSIKTKDGNAITISDTTGVIEVEYSAADGFWHETFRNGAVSLAGDGVFITAAVTGSPAQPGGSLTLVTKTQPAATVCCNATTGTAAPGFTVLGANQVLGGNNAGTGLETKTFAAGTNISVVHTAGTITINNTATGNNPWDSSFTNKRSVQLQPIMTAPTSSTHWGAVGGGVGFNNINGTGGTTADGSSATFGTMTKWTVSGTAGDAAGTWETSGLRIDRPGLAVFTFGTDAAFNNVRLFIGVTNITAGSTGPQCNDSAPSTNFVGLRFSSTTDTNWTMIAANGSAQTTTASSVAPIASTRYVLALDWRTAGQVSFWLNGTLIGTLTTNLPGSTVMVPQIAVCCKTTAAAAIFTGKIYYED